MALDDLPTELLVQIFLCLTDDKPLLCKVALQCRYFNRVVRPILWNHADINFDHDHGTKLDLFIRSIREVPLLCSMVQSLSLKWNTSLVEVNEKAKYIIKRSTALRTFRLQVANPSFNHLYLRSNEMKHLSDVYLSDNNLTIATVAEYMFLGKLQKLGILWLLSPRVARSDILGYGIRDWDMPPLPKGCHPGSSTVTSLDLGPIIHLPMPVFKEILSWPKSLKNLRSMLPGEESANRFGVTKMLSSPLSPARILETLMVVQDSLEDLELIDIGCEWPSHDGTKLDLSNFPSLAKVNVPSTCFFKNFTYGAKRDGLYELLPPSLVELTIVYDFNDCIRPDEQNRDPLTMQPFTLASLDQAPPTVEGLRDLNWLVEFAANKTKKLPRLKRVSVMERCGHLRPGLNPKTWEPPPTIAEAFGVAGIDFRAVMRTRTTPPTFFY